MKKKHEKISFYLLAEISAILYTLDSENIIDISLEELAILLESIYFQIYEDIPKNKKKWVLVLKKAYKDVDWVDSPNPSKKVVTAFYSNFLNFGDNDD